MVVRTGSAWAVEIYTDKGDDWIPLKPDQGISVEQHLFSTGY
jgi:hypothetical protein